MVKQVKLTIKLIVCFSVFLIIGAFILPDQVAQAAAAGPVKVASVEYYEEQLIVLNNNNSKIYFAQETDAAKNNWEVIDADPGLYTMIDISWLTATNQNILVLKGEENPTPYRVIIKEKPLKLEISVNYTNVDKLPKTATIASLVNIMTTAGTGEKPITFDDLEWRKGANGQWESTQSLTVGLLEKFMVKGTYLYFRIRALDDVVTTYYDGNLIDFNEERKNGVAGGIRKYDNPYLVSFVESTFPDGTEGRRFSNEVKVKITKKAAPAVYGIDGSKFTAEIKYGKEYRVTTYTEVEGSPDMVTTSDWIQVIDKSTKNIPLSTIVNQPGIDGTTEAKAFPAMKIEVRDYATAKAASSKITEIELSKQRTLSQSLIQEAKAPDDTTSSDKNIYIYYNGNKNTIIRIPSASTSLQYEYCIKKPGEVFNIAKAAWTTITKSTEIKILASKAPEGAMLYIRQKEIKYKPATGTSDAVAYELASTYVTHQIRYPSIPTVETKSFTYTKGYPTVLSFTVTLNAAGKLPFETEIRDIKLGTRIIEFDAVNTEADGIKYINVTLKDSSLA